MNRANRPRMSRISGSSRASKLMGRAGDGSTLSLDFTAMGGTLDPRITFSRADATALATFVNSSGIVTTVASAQAPRFDFDPTTLAAKGLLLEAPATNVFYYSQDVTQTSRWSIQGSIPGSYTSISATGGTSPNNTNTANLCTESSGYTARSIYQSFSATAGTYTASIWVKAGTGSTRYIRIVMSSGSSDFVYVTANTSTGAVTQSATATGTASAASATVVSYPGSWYRIQLTGTLAAVVNAVFIVPLDSGAPIVIPGDYGRDGYVGNGSTFLIWGAQLEAGASASSLILTGAAGPITRAVDTAIIAAGSNFSSWYTGGTTGTFVANWYGNASSATARSVIATSDQTTKHLHMYQTASALTLRLADFPVTTVTTANSLTAGALTKGAFSYAASATSLCLNGGTVATGTLAFSAAPTWLSIGGTSTNGTSITTTTVMLNNSIRTLQYYPARLTDGQIQGLTT